jgi:hypothetical protein
VRTKGPHDVFGRGDSETSPKANEIMTGENNETDFTISSNQSCDKPPQIRAREQTPLLSRPIDQ